MSYRGYKGSTGKLHKSPVRVLKTRPSGLNQDTLLEGSAIDIALDDVKVSTSLENAFKKDRTNTNNAFKEKYYALLKTVEQLRTELKTQKTRVLDLEDKITHNNDESDKKFRKLQEEHSLCLDERGKLKADVKKTTIENQNLKDLHKKDKNIHSKDISDIKQKQADVLVSLQKKYDEDLMLLKVNFDKDIKHARRIHSDIIKTKDEQLEKLKHQLANTFRENSKERQVQIDELIKELKRVSDEAEYVKSALKKLKFGNECQRCSFFENKCKSISNDLIMKQETCESLFKVCSKMEKQLNQQEDLRVLWSKIKDNNES